MAESIINNKVQKITITTDTINGGTSLSIPFGDYINKPVKAGCVIGWVVSSTYATILYIQDVDVYNNVIKVHTVGTNAQKYTIKLLVFY